MQREVSEDALAFQEQALREPNLSQSKLEQMERTAELARRTLSAIARQGQDLLGGRASLAVDVPDELYFPGHEEMAPAAEALTLNPADEV